MGLVQVQVCLFEYRSGFLALWRPLVPRLPKKNYLRPMASSLFEGYKNRNVTRPGQYLQWITAWSAPSVLTPQLCVVALHFRVVKPPLKHKWTAISHKQIPTKKNKKSYRLFFDKWRVMNMTFFWPTTRHQKHNVRCEKPQVFGDAAQEWSHRQR